MTSKSDCEEAARQLGFSDTSATEEDVGNWPPYCYLHNGRTLYFNKRSNGARDCDSQTAVCICESKSLGPGDYQGCYQDAKARIWPLDGSDPGMEIADWGNTPAR